VRGGDFSLKKEMSYKDSNRRLDNAYWIKVSGTTVLSHLCDYLKIHYFTRDPDPPGSVIVPLFGRKDLDPPFLPQKYRNIFQKFIKSHKVYQNYTYNNLGNLYN